MPNCRWSGSVPGSSVFCIFSHTESRWHCDLPCRACCASIHLSYKAVFLLSASAISCVLWLFSAARKTSAGISQLISCSGSQLLLDLILQRGDVPLPEYTQPRRSLCRLQKRIGRSDGRYPGRICWAAALCGKAIRIEKQTHIGGKKCQDHVNLCTGKPRCLAKSSS